VNKKSGRRSCSVKETISEGDEMNWLELLRKINFMNKKSFMVFCNYFEGKKHRTKKRGEYDCIAW
jgi:hypothetical protein